MSKNWISLYILHIINDGYRACFFILLPFIAKDLQLPFSQVGILGASIGIVTMLIAIPGGFLAGRVGGFVILLYSLLTYSISLIVMAYAPTFWLLIPVFLLAGIGFGIFHTVGFSMVAKLSHEKHIGTQLANFTAVGDIGRVGIPVVVLFFIAMLGWKLVVIGMAVIGIIIFVTLHLTCTSLLKIKSGEEMAEHPWLWLKNAIELFKDKGFLIVTLANVLDQCAYNSMNIFLPFLLLARGATPATLGIFTGAFFAGSFIGKSVLGRMVDIIGYKKVFFISELLMAVSIVLLTLSPNLWLLFIFSVLVGIFSKGTSPVILTMVSKTVQNKHHIKGFAINETVAGVTITIAPLIAGVWADSYGLVSTFYLSAGFALLAIVPVLFYSTLRLKKSS